MRPHFNNWHNFLACQIRLGVFQAQQNIQAVPNRSIKKAYIVVSNCITVLKGYGYYRFEVTFSFYMCDLRFSFHWNMYVVAFGYISFIFCTFELRRLRGSILSTIKTKFNYIKKINLDFYDSEIESQREKYLELLFEYAINLQILL